jgi:hypothetical protein
MLCTGWTVIQEFALWVGIVTGLWGVDGWVIILEFFGKVIGPILVFCVFYYYIVHIHA